MDKAIVVDHLVKNFESNNKVNTVLNDVSFSIQKGELVGFIGPNGAGKTTTMKILTGLLHPSSGFVSVLGYEPWERKRNFLKKISAVFGQKNQLWWDLPVLDSFEFNKEIYEISEKEYNQNLDRLVSILNVSSLLDTQVRKLSLGQRMKMELIASLLHSPKVLFLDEPTIGLDLVSQSALRDFIYEYNKKNEATILLTSHNMLDLVDLTRRVVVVNEGKLIFDGPLEELTKKFVPEKIIKITFSENPKREELEKIGEIKRFSLPQVSIAVARETISFAASEILQNFSVSDLSIEETPIEEVIRKVFKNGVEEKKSN